MLSEGHKNLTSFLQPAIASEKDDYDQYGTFTVWILKFSILIHILFKTSLVLQVVSWNMEHLKEKMDHLQSAYDRMI